MKKLMRYLQEELVKILTEYGQGIYVRQREKQKRFYLDNEVVERGYMNFFGRNWLVYDVIAKHALAKVQACFPSYETIIRETGIKSRNAIAATITAMVKLNILAVQQIPGIRSSVYYLIDSSLWKSLTSITSDTGQVVSKWGTKQYQKQRKSSIAGDTLNQRIKSTKEIRGINLLGNIEKPTERITTNGKDRAEKPKNLVKLGDWVKKQPWAKKEK